MTLEMYFYVTIGIAVLGIIFCLILDWYDRRRGKSTSGYDTTYSGDTSSWFFFDGGDWSGGDCGDGGGDGGSD